MTDELMTLLGQQLRLHRDERGNQFEMHDEPAAVTLICSEEGRRYELVLADSFLQLYPGSLSSDVKRALNYLGEYLRSTENGRLLLTGTHAYEQWDSGTLST